MGKSATTDLLRGLGHPVADSDLIARELVAPGQPALAEIRAAFGERMLGADDSLDRAALAAVVFADPAARQRLEGILHPRIREEWQRRLTSWAAGGAELGAAVIPLLFETGVERAFDAVICVACSSASQLERLRRRGWTDEESRHRIAAQLPIEEKLKRSHFVLWTEPPMAEHGRQLAYVLETLRARNRG